jgi:hypothetical protein
VKPTSLFRGGFFVSGHYGFPMQPSFLWSPTNITGVPLYPVKGRRKSLGNPRGKEYFCSVVSERVEIALKRKPSLSGPNELFVRCNQRDCQYVEVNQSPCPLRIDLFAEEIEKRGKKAQDRKMGF